MVFARSGTSVRNLLFAVIGTASALLLPPKTLPQESNRIVRRVLILYSFDNEEAVYTGFDHALRSRLRMRVRGPIEFYTEYLDLVRFPEEQHLRKMAELLKLKYSQQRPDLVIPVSYSAVQFLLQQGRDLFPGTAMVALFNERRFDELKQYVAQTAQSITGVASTDDPAGTLDLALRLQPDAQQVAVVVGSSPLEHYWLNQLRQDLDSYSSKVNLLYLTGLPLDKLLRQIAELPPHSLVLSTFFFQDATGQYYRPEEVLDLIARETHVPVYSIYSSYIGHGVVGGRMTSSEEIGKKIADLAVAVLNGEKASAIPIVRDDSARYVVDWRELQRWGISEKRLPSSTVELFREPTLWERYRLLLLAMLSFSILQTLLIVALVVNVRRRRRAERRLQLEKTLADAVIECLPGVFVLQDEAGKNVRWNRNAELIGRYNLRSDVALPNVGAHQREAVEGARQQALAKGAATIQTDILLKDGKSAPFYFSVTKVELQGRPYVAGIGIDVTEREKAKEAVRQSDAALRSFVEHAPYGIATIDVTQDRFRHANPAMVKLLGYKSETEVLALSVSRDLLAENDRNFFNVEPAPPPFFKALDLAWKRKDGQLVNVRASGRRTSQSDEKGILVEIIAEDVTAQRRLEEQLRQAQKMEALGQLSGSVAHDFNNLLSVIIGYSELLSANPAAQESMRAQLATIKRAGERAASLTTQLLAFSRRQVLQPSVVNLNSVLRETEKMLKRLMREDIEQRLVLDPALWKTKADPGQLVQVILNLAINARDAMPKGGTLTIETSNVTVAEGTTFHKVEVPAGRYVRLSVADTGIGIDSLTQARIFEPFFTTKEAGKGTGLGLATVYGIVQQTGGYISVGSELGKGTRFTIHLPRFDRTPEPQATQPASGDGGARSGRRHSETLLVVEDESSFRDLLRDGLQAKGYNVLVAANGVEALGVAERHGGPIRVLVTDVIMPQMSGPELASTLRKVRPGIEVLYMSGYANDKLREESSSGDLMLLQKPFYIDELEGKIQAILARRSTDQA